MIFQGLLIFVYSLFSLRNTLAEEIATAKITNHTSAENSSPGRRLERYQYHPLLEHCRDKGEAYGASFLVRKDFFLGILERYMIGRTQMYGNMKSNQGVYEGEEWLKRRKELLKRANVESATFTMMSHVTDRLLNESGLAYRGGRIYQSIDMLDFSVLHLSTFERLLHRYSEHKKVKEQLQDFSAIEQATEALKLKALERSDVLRARHLLHADIPTHDELYFHRTVVVMPYLGVDQGEGNSKIIYRQRYLAACFWSFYAYYPYVVIAVTSSIDRDYILKQSGLPVFDVLYLPDLPVLSSLPLASVLGVARRLSVSATSSGATSSNNNENNQQGSDESDSYLSPAVKRSKRRIWKTQFQYIFYTESDQMLLLRSEEQTAKLYEAIQPVQGRKLDQDFMLSPHRLTVYPEVVLQNIYKFPVDTLNGIPLIPVQDRHGLDLTQRVARESLSQVGRKPEETAPAKTSKKPQKIPPETLKSIENLSGSASSVDQYKPVIEWQCCQQPSQMCRRPREHWAVLTANSEKLKQNPHPTSPSLIKTFHAHMYVALGNVDFHYERFHGCPLTGVINRDPKKPLLCPNE